MVQVGNEEKKVDFCEHLECTEKSKDLIRKLKPFDSGGL
jgi:hypothetical protein